MFLIFEHISSFLFRKEMGSHELPEDGAVPLIHTAGAQQIFGDDDDNDRTFSRGASGTEGQN